MKNNENMFSWEALVRIVTMGIIIFLCWRALSVIPVIIVASVLVVSFYPAVKKLQKTIKIPLVMSIFLILIVPIIPFIYFGYIFIPRIVAEMPNLLSSINLVVSNSPYLHNLNIVSYLQSHFDYTSATIDITLLVFSIISTLVLAFFLMYDFERLSALFLSLIPGKEKNEMKELFKEVSLVTGRYIRGNLLISLICGVVVYIGLYFLHIPFALPLAVFAAVFDLLPLVGQTVGSIPAIIIGFGVSPFTGALVIVLHLIYQQIENDIISPVIYNKALNLFPSIIFLSVLIGASLFGVLGAFLSLPVAASIPAIINYRKNYKIRYSVE
ncbi:MAG: AI-2E family transporter [Candidatus Nomurabacteria bacterium]|nr:AI-2E family transporter [Candidatus Nomurabacteria bacterium]